MYRYGNGQISLSDFQQPMGMCLREDNRWVKKAQLLPWDKIEAKYAGLFPSATGNVAKPLQLALGACLIQREYGYSDEEIVLQIQENRICGIRYPQDVSLLEFGMKLDISISNGWTRLEYHSFDAYNEATKLQEMIENFHRHEGHYPSRVLADKIYRNRENLRYCKERGIRLSGPALGRPKKGEERNKVQDYQDECERVEVERKFSLGKRKCGMGMVTAKLEDTAAHVVALSILLLNLRKIQYAFLQFLDWLLGFLQPCKKLRVVQ